MSSPDEVLRQKIATLLQELCAANYVRKNNVNVPCQIEEGLFLGSVRVACNKQALKCLNITHVLIVSNSLEPAFPNDFVYKKIEVLDTPVTNISKYFHECFDFIDQARHAGGGALVHCFAGRSRSVTVIIAYLMKQHQMSLSQAFSFVKSKRPNAGPNSGFMTQLQNYEKSLRVVSEKTITGKNSISQNPVDCFLWWKLLPLMLINRVLGFVNMLVRAAFSDNRSRANLVWGASSVIFGFILFSVFTFAAILSKLLPPFDNKLLSAMQKDRYYCLLVPLTLPVVIVAVYFHWLGMKLFKHA
ncbi:hypothetical protein KFK09_019110 [Dendrobium nobile]|uniref:Uncharacterized protein n=1 Tax=Dendrobium nobile TaxID=94219 RepID=A0A8T3AZ14_DENNO|nr:hypothetical protein KFK09_019110 [Dendrobium nobile]